MKSRAYLFIVVAIFIAAGVAFLSAYEAIVGPTGVLLYDKENSYGGYTLVAPMGSRTTYLIDIEGYVVHKWEAQYTPGSYAMLLENGNLLRGGTLQGAPAQFGGAGGIVQEIDWDGKVVWEYKLMNDKQVQHHCFARMPNGNTLMLAWERIGNAYFIDKGRDPKKVPVTGPGFTGKFQNDFWVDFVREVNPAGETVWEWHVWDHIGTGPYQFDINYTLRDTMGGSSGIYDWTHFNAVEYIPENDQVLLNSRNFSEFYIIDHKTGAMVYRWGNPSAYGQGEAPSFLNNGDQKMFGNHNATYLGRNRFLIFDNGSERPEGNRSAVIEVDARTGNIEWEYTAPTSNSFYTARQGGAQRLSNGNTFITSSNSGHLFEVTQDKKVVWDFVSPVSGQDQTACFLGGGGAAFNMIHRAYRYGADYAGLKGRDLTQRTVLAKDCPEFYKLYKTDQAPAPKKKALPKL
jgi:outer membrane protein assembly factor BamB